MLNLHTSLPISKLHISQNFHQFNKQFKNVQQNFQKKKTRNFQGKRIQKKNMLNLHTFLPTNKLHISQNVHWVNKQFNKILNKN